MLCKLFAAHNADQSAKPDCLLLQVSALLAIYFTLMFPAGCGSRLHKFSPHEKVDGSGMCLQVLAGGKLSSHNAKFGLCESELS